MCIAIGVIGSYTDFFRNNSAMNSIMENVEALADTEGSGQGVVIGHCGDTANDCMGSCPHCNALYYALTTKKGPSSNVRGTCSQCKKTF